MTKKQTIVVVVAVLAALCFLMVGLQRPVYGKMLWQEEEVGHSR